MTKRTKVVKHLRGVNTSQQEIDARKGIEEEEAFKRIKYHRTHAEIMEKKYGKKVPEEVKKGMSGKKVSEVAELCPPSVANDPNVDDTEIEPLEIEDALREHEGAFITIDIVKDIRRAEITRALHTLRDLDTKWSTNMDDSAGVCGMISERIARVRRQPEAELPMLPSLSMLERFPKTSSDHLSLGFPVEFTKFTVSPNADDDGEFREIHWDACKMSFPKDVSIYGTGENAGSLLLNDMLDYEPLEHSYLYDRKREGDNFTPIQHEKSNKPKRPRNCVVCWNTDACFYDESFEALYQSHPWYLVVLPSGLTWGILTDSTYRTVIHFVRKDHGIDIYTMSEAPLGPPPIYVFKGTPQEVAQDLARMTGTMPMPPLWAVGNQQCRYSYFPDTQVKEIASAFRQTQIPCDVIWMDIHYMHEYRCFTFDPELFPNPEELNSYLHENGFHSVYMIDPGIKEEKGYWVYDEGKERDVFIKESPKSKDDCVGRVWPGDTVFPDFTKKSTREWWRDLFPEYAHKGVDGVWNDMNEIASFQQGSTIPVESYHRADSDLGGPDTNARYHNVYGMLMTSGTREGMMKAYPNRRPFVLTRANFIGGHRYAASWTGDNSSNWDHLHFSIPMILNLGLSGQPFSGCDIGGFFDNATAEMFDRWYNIGALLPFCRAHSCAGTIDHEPWNFGLEVEKSCKKAMERRYRLIPTYYTLFWEASKTGLPICRPLFWTDTKDMALRDADDAFLLGDNIMVRVCTGETDLTCYAAMPKNNRWERFPVLEDDEFIDKKIPEFWMKAGSIVYLGPIMNFTNERPLDPLTLIVCLGADERAEGILYEDDGDGWDYLQGKFRLTKYVAQKINGTIEITSQQIDGSMPGFARKINIFHLENGVFTKYVGQEPLNNFRCLLE